MASAGEHLAILLLLPGLLYAAARVPGGMDDAGLLASGYAFFPVLVAMIFAIFPLTLRELGAAYGMILLAFLAIEALAGTLFAPLALQVFWLLLLTVAICTWASANHLRTLLQLYRQATRDLLTGLLNRRALTEQLERELRRAERYGRQLTLLMMDLDRFKRLNDEYGHLAGDQVLREFARLSSGILRESDVLGRWGGEEFIAGLVETPADQAEGVAERLRKACEETSIETEDGNEILFTVSIGLAPVRAKESLNDAIKRVDDALYAAKANGRNRVTKVD
ncbi:MAG: GGDEF domain-containing protein [Halofilum sp. (in: g-proteobacteria)]|nr:GGDEF domain-containing protein [Halofilum sp. (in: g-proteobacteria)]